MKSTKINVPLGLKDVKFLEFFRLKSIAFYYVDKLKKLLTIPGSVPDNILIISDHFGKYPALAGY